MKRISTLFAFVSLVLNHSAIAGQASFVKLIPWSEIEMSQHLRLQDTLVVNPQFSLPGESYFLVTETLTLDPVPVMVFSLRAVSCSESNDPKPVEMTILGDSYGFEWKNTCTAELYVEFKDLSKPSYFRR